MHKKYVKSLFLFLTLLMIIITITTVSATDTNETSTMSHESNTQSVVLSEKTGNDFNPEKNNEQMYTYDDSLNTKTDDNLNDTTSVETKSLKKYYKTENKEYTSKSSSTLTVGSTKTVYVGDKVSIYGRLSSYSSRIPYSKVEIEINNKYYYATTNAYGDYKLNVTGSNQGTNYIYAYYYGSDKYYSSSASTTFTVNKKTSNLTVGSTKTTYIGDTISVYGKLSARGIGLAYKNVKIDVNGKLYNVTTSQYGNYNLKVKALNEGYNYVTATYSGSNIYTYDTVSTYFTANNKNVLTLGSTKSVYVGDKVSVYGKLTSKGKNVANAKITVTLDYTTYTTYTSKYGNYNLKVTPSTSGTKTITAKYTDNNYNSVYNTTTFQANKKITNLTVGSTKSVYVGDKVSVYGKLSARGIGLAYKDIEIDVEGNKYYVTTSKYGNYNLKVTADKEGYNDITATYDGTNIYASDSAYTYVYASKKITSITVGSTKNVNLGDTVSIYGKLSARGIGLAYKNVEIDVGGDKYYVTTSKYGNYNLKITTTSIGNKKITASFSGSNVYYSDNTYTYFEVTKKDSKITVGATNSPHVGDDVNIYGKLTSKGVGIPNQEVVINVDGTKYYVTTSKYGNYNLTIDALKIGNNYITVYYSGDSTHKSSSTNTKFTVTEPFGTLLLDVGTLKKGVSTVQRYVGNNQFWCWYQGYTAQYDKGINVEVIGHNPKTDRYSASSYAITGAYFFFKDSQGNIVWDEPTIDYGYYNYIGHKGLSDYTPYKVVVYYRKATASEMANGF